MTVPHVDKAVAERWKRKYGADRAPSCEELRRQILHYIRFLRRQCEALLLPVDKWEALLETEPNLNLEGHTTEGGKLITHYIDDVLNDALEVGQVARRIARQRERAKATPRPSKTTSKRKRTTGKDR